MSSKYCGTLPYKQGTYDENIRKQIQISWDNVLLNQFTKWDICKFHVSNGAKFLGRTLHNIWDPL